MEDRWDALFSRYREGQALEREEQARAERQQQAQLQEHAALIALLNEVLNAVATQARQRALQFERATQHGVEIRILGKDSGQRSRYVELSLGAERVLVYGHHELGTPAFIHFLIACDDAFGRKARHPRLVSLPGARLTGGSPSAPELWSASGPVLPLSIDDLVFRGFELVLRRSSRRAQRWVQEKPATSARASTTLSSIEQ